MAVGRIAYPRAWRGGKGIVALDDHSAALVRRAPAPATRRPVIDVVSVMPPGRCRRGRLMPHTRVSRVARYRSGLKVDQIAADLRDRRDGGNRASGTPIPLPALAAGEPVTASSLAPVPVKVSVLLPL